MSDNEAVRRAFANISTIANRALIETDNFPPNRHQGTAKSVPDYYSGCIVKSLPRRLLAEAAETAKKVNPVNAPVVGSLAADTEVLGVSQPLLIAVLTSKYWGPQPRVLTVSFMETIGSDLRDKIMSHMNAWTQTTSVSFASTDGVGDVRISRGEGGYWSYLGTDILHIPRDRQTMNLQDFSLSTPESEYRRVVRHETGHTLGFPHEHMRNALISRIDPDKAYSWFWQTYGWDKQTVDEQVLTPLDEASLMGTPPDQTSIMCYQLPGSITKDGNPIIGGTDINETDFRFAGKIYPKPGSTQMRAGDWPESEDVRVHV